MMQSLLNRLQVVAPVEGVSIGHPQDKATWRVDFTPAATEADRVAAYAVVAAFDVLEDVKTNLKHIVDEDAERVRLRYITPGDGMQQTYREKFEQATAVNGMGQDAANALSEQQRNASFPVLAASVGIEAATLWECSQIVLQRFAQWAQITRLIETKRLAGKKAISEASDAAAAQAAYEAITWTDLP